MRRKSLLCESFFAPQDVLTKPREVILDCAPPREPRGPRGTRLADGESPTAEEEGDAKEASESGARESDWLSEAAAPATCQAAMEAGESVPGGYHLGLGA